MASLQLWFLKDVFANQDTVAFEGFETAMPAPKAKKPLASTGSKIPTFSTSSENKVKAPQVKRSSSPGPPRKRTAFIDITNASKVKISIPRRKKCAAKKLSKKTSSLPMKNQHNLKSESETPETGDSQEAEEVETPMEWVATVEEPQPPAPALPPTAQDVPAHLRKQDIPEEFDIDSENSEDCHLCPEYAKDIFDYLKAREEKFPLCNYMSMQPSLNPEMRAVLIDWLVEVQENFELYHETLYLAVKMTDHYLSKVPIQREMLQLIGSTAMLIASKFEERSPPCVDDFLYICDDAYQKEELLSTEVAILQTLSYNVNIPIPYRFLRRYAKCVNAGMDTLTLARYYCELSLMEMEMVTQRGSLLASACLLMALVNKDLGGWTPILQFHSGYKLQEVAPVVRMLHDLLSSPANDKLRAVRNKYSHKVFFEVTSVPLISKDALEEALSHELQT